MTHLFRILCLSTAALGAVSANAAVLYSSGAINGNYGGNTINHCCKVTDSFTLASASTITGFTFGGWTEAGNIATAVTWGISTSADFTEIASTSLTASAVIGGAGAGYYNVRTYTGTIAPLTLAAGTYWLTLANATSTNPGNDVYWDINSGSSQAYQYFYGTGSVSQSNGHSFTITGTEAAVPEPASWAMIVGGFGMIGAALRRRQRTSLRFA